tara:strand:- start:753 stop:1013 length:261 start_codon:yes stop_codon:yes gene_type:complete
MKQGGMKKTQKNFLNLNRKNKRKFKKWKTWLNTKQSSNYLLKAFLRYLKDIENNPNFETMEYANNNFAVHIRGCNLNLVRLGHKFN